MRFERMCCRAGWKEREVQRLSFDVTSDGIPKQESSLEMAFVF